MISSSVFSSQFKELTRSSFLVGWEGAFTLSIMFFTAKMAALWSAVLEEEEEAKFPNSTPWRQRVRRLDAATFLRLCVCGGVGGRG